MSKVVISIPEQQTIVTKLTDSNGSVKETSHQKTVFKPLDKPDIPKSVIVNVDYLGNIYLKHGDSYYIVGVDQYSSSGVELTKIKSPDVFRRNLLDSKYLRNAIKSGVIKANSLTLRGKVSETISDMTDEERADYMDKNEYALNSMGCEEKRYFWVKYENQEELDEGEENDGFYINGAVDPVDINNGSLSGMVYSDLLAVTPGTFETILVDGDIGSKRVVSNTERIDGYSTAHLTIYTSGKIKANFIDVNRMSQLCYDETSGELTTCAILNVVTTMDDDEE
ncbi:hypothetical protein YASMINEVIRUS_338 [Yasminevirus sp. GU-2018]|uniref:Uncharacterized protein n=1 Tax=Yasminevirus sp. GU-2018 TaxID=2420051 RepID=A0A5K0U7W5_9VIRU|nr:hypothetical protein YASMINEVIRUS_338 [Yasminevirus sp. GU-2018]